MEWLSGTVQSDSKVLVIPAFSLNAYKFESFHKVTVWKSNFAVTEDFNHLVK